MTPNQEHNAGFDAPVRGHLLTVTKTPDWHEDDPDWAWSITCLAPDKCDGYIECLDPHGPDNTASMGPYEAEGQPWEDQDYFEFHGVEHEWRYGWGWTVPYPGCVVADNDGICDAAWEIARKYGEGVHEVEDDWFDEQSCDLLYVTTVNPPGAAS